MVKKYLLLSSLLSVISLMTGCGSTASLSGSDIEGVWMVDSQFYLADLRVDTETDSYSFYAGDARFISKESGGGIGGFGYKAGEVNAHRISISQIDFRRLWYFRDITVHLRDERILQLESGKWYMAFEDGVAVYLATAETLKKDDTGVGEQAVELFAVEEIALINATASATRSSPSGPGGVGSALGEVMTVLGVLAGIILIVGAVVFVIALSDMSWPY